MQPTNIRRNAIYPATSALEFGRKVHEALERAFSAPVPRVVLRLDTAGRAAAIETITNPPDVDCVSNDWVPEMYAYLEAGLGRVLPNLEIDRTPAGYQHAGGFAG